MAHCILNQLQILGEMPLVAEADTPQKDEIKKKEEQPDGPTESPTKKTNDMVDVMQIIMDRLLKSDKPSLSVADVAAMALKPDPKELNCQC